ncbi:MAG: hypothetical protein DWQ08_00540 [Proteobacteria bacterium]|nr:MAG: hypothetical protein DWQ08_00540 [Pseudomonadota bacterium]
MLLTAHHRGDEAETVLYKWFRGAGTRGLAAMPAVRPFAGGMLARPFLDLPRESLRQYASEHGLNWIEDPANERLDFDRNFIRHRLMPLVMARWPAAEGNIRRASINAADSLQVLERAAALDIAAATISGAFNPLSKAPVLDAGTLRDLPLENCFNAVRHWVNAAGYAAPPRRRIAYLRSTLVEPEERPSGCFAFDGVEIRRYRHALYLLEGVARIERQAVAWSPDRALPIPGTPIELVAIETEGTGLARRHLDGRALTVDWTTTDRTLRVVAGGPRKSLRKLFQELGVPPFIRRALPRISAAGAVLCVPGVADNVDYRAERGEPGVRFRLRYVGVSRGDSGQ